MTKSKTLVAVVANGSSSLQATYQSLAESIKYNLDDDGFETVIVKDPLAALGYLKSWNGEKRLLFISNAYQGEVANKIAEENLDVLVVLLTGGYIPPDEAATVPTDGVGLPRGKVAVFSKTALRAKYLPVVLA